MALRFPHITFSDYVNVKTFSLKTFYLHGIQVCIIKQQVNGIFKALINAVEIALATCFLLLQTICTHVKLQMENMEH